MPRIRILVYLFLAGMLLIGSVLGSQVTGSTAPLDDAPQGTIPVGPQINLAVTLQRPNAPAPHPSWAVPVQFAVYAPGDAATPLYSFDLTLSESGTWQGRLLMDAGTYDLRLKNMHTLRNVKRNVVISSTATIDMGTLHEGDADEDNRVRASDFTLLRATYFTVEGDAGFNPHCDFDEDNRIRSSDFALLRGSYFMTGDIEVTALAANAITPAGTVALALTPARVNVAPGETFTLTLTANAGDQDFVSVDADIRFPPGLLQVVGPDGAPTSAVQALPPLDAYMNQVDNTAGRILYAAGTFGDPVNGDVPLAQIRFRPLQAAGVAEIALVDSTVADETGKWVTGARSGAQAWIAAAVKTTHLPVILKAE